MAVISGYYALGTGVSNLSVFVEATTYTRGTVNLAGTALAGLSQSITQITGPTGPTGGVLTKGAIFDALTGGNCLCYWDWTTLTTVPANFLAVTISIVFNTYVATALNLSLQGGQATSGSTLDQGAQIGTVNGQPLIAGTRLGIQSGTLIALGTERVQPVGSGLVFQSNGLNIAGLSSTGIWQSSAADGLTAHAGGTQAAALPITTGANRFGTVATSLDSAVLPVCSVGSMVAVQNAGAATMALYPDKGAAINAGSADAALSVPTAKSILLVRTAALEWISIPTVPT